MRAHVRAREAGIAVCVCGWEKRREHSPPPRAGQHVAVRQAPKGSVSGRDLGRFRVGTFSGVTLLPALPQWPWAHAVDRVAGLQSPA